jgi:hypothetical protein
MDYGASDTSTTTLGTNQFPISEVWTPNAGFSATEGGAQSTDAGGKKSAPVSVSVKDGSDVTQGTSTDANTVNSVMGRLTKIRDLLNATLTVGGTITEANSAAIKADLDAVNTAIGLISDAAWSGSGNGSEIAILKKIVAELAGTIAVSGTFWQATQPVSGTVTANAGTNLNTSALALESGGHLANIDTHTPALGQSTKANSVPVTLASDQGDLLIKGDFTEQASLSAGALNADLVPATDVSAYKWWSLQVSAIASGGTLTFQYSNDGVTYNALTAFRLDNPIGSNSASTTASANTLWGGPCLFRFLRVRQTAWTSGSSTGTLELYTQEPGFAFDVLSVVQSGTWTVQPGNTANTTAWKVDGSAVTQPVSGTFWQATQPVSGTVTANQGAPPWSDNVTQFGGTNLSTGTGAGGAGIPRVTVSNDSNVLATQSGTWTMQPGNTANTAPWLVKPHDGTNPLYLAAAALADAMSNPTIGGIQNFAMWFNGTSWDRARNNVNTTTGDTGTKTATFAGATQTNYNARGAYITILLGTVSGTTPTLAAQLQWSPDGGTTWLNIGTVLPNLTATSQTGLYMVYPTQFEDASSITTLVTLSNGATVSKLLNMPLPRTWRLNYTIGGTTPSFAISSVQVNYIL